LWYSHQFPTVSGANGGPFSPFSRLDTGRFWFFGVESRHGFDSCPSGTLSMSIVATLRPYGARGVDDSPKPRSIEDDLDRDIRLGCDLHRVSAKHPATVHNSAELIQDAAVACLGR
jgi:hypothetical protein